MKNNFIFRTAPLNTDLAALLLRFILGGLFVYHGYIKIENYNTILPMFTDIIGIGKKLSFNLIIFAEFGCGLLVTIGLFTRLSVIPIFICMFVAYFIAHKNDAFMMKTLPFAYMLICLPVFVLGSGRFSADHFLFGRR